MKRNKSIKWLKHCDVWETAKVWCEDCHTHLVLSNIWIFKHYEWILPAYKFHLTRSVFVHRMSVCCPSSCHLIQGGFMVKLWQVRIVCLMKHFIHWSLSQNSYSQVLLLILMSCHNDSTVPFPRVAWKPIFSREDKAMYGVCSSQGFFLQLKKKNLWYCAHSAMKMTAASYIVLKMPWRDRLVVFCKWV